MPTTHSLGGDDPFENHLSAGGSLGRTVSNFECDAALRLHDRTRGRVPATAVLPTAIRTTRAASATWLSLAALTTQALSSLGTPIFLVSATQSPIL